MVRVPAGQTSSRRSCVATRRAFALGLFFAFEALHVAVAWDGARLFRAAAAGLPDPGCARRYGASQPGRRGPHRAARRLAVGRPDPTAGSKALALLAYPLATGAVFLLLGVNIDASLVVPVVLVGTPLVAFNEEGFFRGSDARHAPPLGWRRAIIGVADAVRVGARR